MAKATASERNRSKQLPAPMPEEPSSAIAMARLKDDLAQQTAFGISKITAEINNERKERVRFERNLNRWLVVFGVFVIALAMVVLFNIEITVRDTVSKEMTTFASATSQTLREGTQPILESINRQSEASARAAQLDQALTVLYGHEQLAMAGSKDSFMELRRLALRQDEVGLVAKGRVQQVKDHYAFVKMPHQGTIEVETPPIRKSGLLVALDSLTSKELIHVLCMPEASPALIQRALKVLWNRPVDRGMEREFDFQLKTTNNLSSAIATTSLLRRYFGIGIDIYDFDGWSAFLAKRNR